LVGGGILIGSSIHGAARQPAIAKRAFTAPAPAGNVAGSLALARGVTVDGKTATAGDVLIPGADVAVGLHGLAEIDVVRGGRVHLYPGTHVALSARGELVSLEQGKVWCQVDKGKGRFAVRADRAEARVLGTSFVVERAASGDTDVRVIEGTVEVEDADRRGKVRVKGGQRTQSSSAPGRPSRAATTVTATAMSGGASSTRSVALSTTRSSSSRGRSNSAEQKRPLDELTREARLIAARGSNFVMRSRPGSRQSRARFPTE
jgi:ferric-dicitrate binding protein FerR (iron transport regulator)